MPESWLTGIVILIHKKNDPKDINNYRPITLLTSIYKIWATVISNRLYPIMNLLTNETQCGYKYNKSTFEIIFNIKRKFIKKERDNSPNPI